MIRSADDDHAVGLSFGITLAVSSQGKAANSGAGGGRNAQKPFNSHDFAPRAPMLAIQNEISSIHIMGRTTCTEVYVRLQTPTSELRDLNIRTPENGTQRDSDFRFFPKKATYEPVP
ncbi:MAG: hypothetical protein CMJ62_14420 [Planctomycetaceae bacterium]|nr:hypothetical protein [Planctomycetaceae bacterium]